MATQKINRITCDWNEDDIIREDFYILENDETSLDICLDCIQNIDHMLKLGDSCTVKFVSYEDEKKKREI